MLLGIVFQNGVEIDRGIWVGGKHFHTDHPEQSLTICDSCSAYHVDNERKYEHNEDQGIHFQEWQSEDEHSEFNHLAYDSVEKIDRMIQYPLPRWMETGGPIPNYEHRMEDGQVVSERKGNVK
jgi:hypothetical protein